MPILLPLTQALGLMPDSVTFVGKVVRFGGVCIELPYKIGDAFSAEDMAVVLLDPDDYLADPAYGKDRRRGLNPLKNLLAISRNGSILWEAEFPDSVDYYYQITSRNPLLVSSFSSHTCKIDLQTGKILSKTFCK